jgi:hypothetical protein
MRKRFALLWTPVVLGLALMLPATTAAATYGKIANTNTYCTNGGNRVNGTFKLTKYSGFYATTLEMTAYGQVYYSNGWHNSFKIGPYHKTVNTSGGASYTETFWFNDHASGPERLNVIGKFKNGSSTIATGHAHSLVCG